MKNLVFRLFFFYFSNIGPVFRMWSKFSISIWCTHKPNRNGKQTHDSSTLRLWNQSQIHTGTSSQLRPGGGFKYRIPWVDIWHNSNILDLYCSWYAVSADFAAWLTPDERKACTNSSRCNLKQLTSKCGFQNVTGRWGQEQTNIIIITCCTQCPRWPTSTLTGLLV